jgi:hypothetical protein
VVNTGSHICIICYLGKAKFSFQYQIYIYIYIIFINIIIIVKNLTVLALCLVEFLRA